MTSERLDVIAHRGWFDVPICARELATGNELELGSNDGRWGLRASVVAVDQVSNTSTRVTLDRRSARIFAIPPVEGVDE